MYWFAWIKYITYIQAFAVVQGFKIIFYIHLYVVCVDVKCFLEVGYMVIKYSLNMKDKPLVIVYRMKESTLI